MIWNPRHVDCFMSATSRNIIPKGGSLKEAGELMNASQHLFDGRVGAGLAVLGQEVNEAGETREELLGLEGKLPDLDSDSMLNPFKEGDEDSIILDVQQATESSVEIEGLVSEEVHLSLSSHCSGVKERENEWLSKRIGCRGKRTSLYLTVDGDKKGLGADRVWPRMLRWMSPKADGP